MSLYSTDINEVEDNQSAVCVYTWLAHGHTVHLYIVCEHKSPQDDRVTLKSMRAKRRGGG